MIAPNGEPKVDRRSSADPRADLPEAVLIEVGGAPFLFPRNIEEHVAAVLRGKYDYGVLPDPPVVRRIVDLRATVGDFACWAWKRWPNSWVECYEPDSGLQRFLNHNAPPGAAIHPVSVNNVRSAAALPPCDVLRLDTGGGEAEVLSGYRHVPSVVCFDWHRGQDRLDIEKLLSSWGLRCFKILFRNPDLGHEVWVRSRAVWSYEKKAYVLP